MVDVNRSLPFSLEARTTLTYAHEEIMQLNHRYIGTEHLLLALVRCDSNIAEFFMVRGISKERLRASVQNVRNSSGSSGPETELTRRAVLALERGTEIAQEEEASLVAPVHMLLGLLEITDSIAVGVLKSYGLMPRELAAGCRRFLAPSR